MATEGHIDVGTTSVQLDTTLVTQSTASGGRTVHREAVLITDPATNAARAVVGSSDPGSTDYGLVVRPINPAGGLTTSPILPTDAFGRVRVSDPVTLFDSQFQYDKQPLIWNEDTANSGTATHLPNESAVRLRAATNNGSQVVLQTRNYMRYQPGKSQLIFVTFNFEEAVTNNAKRVGYFDADNGIFLEQDGSTLNIVRRTSTSGSAVDNEVAQASWSVDAFDGSGASGVTLDFTKTQILIIDLEWLGVGLVRVGFVVDGKIYLAHEFKNANSLTVPYMTTANLPVRYEITNSAALGATTDLKAICASVISEGGLEEQRAFPFATGTDAAGETVTGTEAPVISIRPASTFNSITNQTMITLTSIWMTAATKNTKFRVMYNPSLTGASFGSVDSNSAVEVDTSASSFTGGTEIESILLLAGGEAEGTTRASGQLTRLPFGFDIDGSNPDIISVVAESVGGDGTAHVTFRWSELR